MTSRSVRFALNRSAHSTRLASRFAYRVGETYKQWLAENGFEDSARGLYDHGRELEEAFAQRVESKAILTRMVPR
jgi:hypothetical protein